MRLIKSCLFTLLISLFFTISCYAETITINNRTENIYDDAIVKGSNTSKSLSGIQTYTYVASTGYHLPKSATSVKFNSEAGLVVDNPYIRNRSTLTVKNGLIDDTAATTGNFKGKATGTYKYGYPVAVHQTCPVNCKAQGSKSGYQTSPSQLPLYSTAAASKLGSATKLAAKVTTNTAASRALTYDESRFTNWNCNSNSTASSIKYTMPATASTITANYKYVQVGWCDLQHQVTAGSGTLVNNSSYPIAAWISTNTKGWVGNGKSSRVSLTRKATVYEGSNSVWYGQTTEAAGHVKYHRRTDYYYTNADNPNAASTVYRTVTINSPQTISITETSKRTAYDSKIGAGSDMASGVYWDFDGGDTGHDEDDDLTPMDEGELNQYKGQGEISLQEDYDSDDGFKVHCEVNNNYSVYLEGAANSANLYFGAYYYGHQQSETAIGNNWGEWKSDSCDIPSLSTFAWKDYAQYNGTVV